MITARRFTAFHTPLIVLIVVFSSPATTMQSFPPATNALQRASKDSTILSKQPFYRFDERTTPLLYFLFVVGLSAAIQENMSRGRPLSQSESVKYPLHLKYSGGQSRLGWCDF